MSEVNNAPVSDAAPAAADETEADTGDFGTDEASEPAPQPTQAEIKRLKKLKLKVDGQEFDEELPFEIEDKPEYVEWMKKQLQLSKVSQKRMQEQTQLVKEVEEFVSALRENPKKILSDERLGVDLKKLVAEMIEEEVEQSKKTPQQIEKERLEQELQAIKEEREREKQESQKREFERLQKQEYERYDMLMNEALKKSNLPETDYTKKKIAEYMLLALSENVDVTPDDVIPLVREEMQKDLQKLLSVMPEEAAEAIIGKELLGKLRKRKVAAAKSAINKPNITEVAKPGDKEAKKPEPISMRDFFKVR